MRDFTASLPPEVQRTILSYLVPNVALQHARLVNKQWSAVAATLLWHQLHVDLHLYHADRPRFNALLNSSPNGILDNVKKLGISSSLTTSNPLQTQQTTSILLKLLSALPRDNLSSLHSETLPVHPDVICVLLRTQSQLRELSIPTDEDSSDGLPGGAYARNNLSHLEKITVDVSGASQQTYRGVCAWFAYAPKLHEVSIKGRHHNDPAFNRFGGWAASAQPHLVKLRRLAVRDICFMGTPYRIVQHLDLPSLEYLSLRECFNAGPFLLSLAQKFKQSDEPVLRNFSHCQVSMSEDVQEASAELIGSVNSLTHLNIGLMEGGLMDLECLKMSGRSLIHLHLLCMDVEFPYYSAVDLVQLRLLCPKLEHLSIDIGDLNSFFDDVGLNEPFRLAEHTGYMKKLEVIAQYANLVSLSITDPALLDGEYSANERRLIYTEVASQLFQELAEHGSHLQRLHFSSRLYESMEAEADEDGHTWPRYAFERGNVSVTRYGQQVTVKTLAVPAPQDVRGLTCGAGWEAV
ncbi:uncharacterized protein M421DRAFT_93731 [Didymella exigua CBS 183.55]|uniref:F-box domain-containing protein n=1 Tax=Didymella exigua CBS 183.55 TaxID=1150837 RepID=A0A6A5RH58_9PLEO|nr:uncharacterized protein M421DRAFT_93731 [Didymella exigua CBS 183.55]KAF1926833.1 hypothetical protein M421DRAFT_93731 [Didymella exigua CBS 183.55]